MLFQCIGQVSCNHLMWKDFTEEGQLKYQFMDTVTI
jgi:cbb3-type cytochrome oxidase subunit 1